MTRDREPPLHVLMTADAVGGVWTYALDLARAVVEDHVRTTLVVLGPPPESDQQHAARDIPGLRLIVAGTPLDWTADTPEALAGSARPLEWIAERAQPDIIHLNSPALAAHARLRAPVVGVCHSCVGTWWAAVRGGEPPDDFRWRMDVLARGYAACDRLAAPSHAFAQATAEVYGVRPAVVLNGRRRPASPLRPPSERGRQVFSAGRLWDPGKNVVTLDAAAGRTTAPVMAAGPLAGPGGARTVLDHVRSLGRMEAGAVTGGMGASPVFVSAALYEPFGLTALEAAQAGCALVLSDIPTFRELWDGAAVFFPARDDQALAGAVSELLGNPARLDDLGARAARRAERYGVGAMAESTLALWRDALACRTARREDAA